MYLSYDIDAITTKGKFSKNFFIPMIKVHDKLGQDESTGIEDMKDIVKARMDISLFESEDILEDLIRLSGGCLRDLFNMIDEAAWTSLDDDKEKIDAEGKKDALNMLKK